MTEEESYYVSQIIEHMRTACVELANKLAVRAYLHGVEHGKQGVELSSEELLEILDIPS